MENMRTWVTVLFVGLSMVAMALPAAGTEYNSDDQLISQVIDRQAGGDGDDELGSANFLDAASLMLDAELHFKNFVKKYNKVYGSVEFANRLAIFKDNLLRVVENQALDPEAQHGITPFMDLSEEEFTARYLGLLDQPDFVNRSGKEIPSLPTEDLPANFDWRDAGAVTEVKNQGACGSCWAFSTTGAIEGAHFLATGKLISLSEQQLVDCDHQCDPQIQYACDSGCNGGLMTNAYEYVIKAGGLEKESDYPYTGTDGKCKFDSNKIVVKVSNFTNIPVDEAQIAANLVKHGPLAVGINAAFMQTYIGGVSCPIICSKKRLDHGVLLVGYGDHGLAPLRLKYKPYWIIKNSWGASWGENGYYKICRGHGECGVNTMVSSVAAAFLES
ncbi:hypothetical protein Mapa_002312 [Marchantia paleacea]|nr:hypothetical protein Mapa_002312 [Marchantia paleacea]